MDNQITPTNIAMIVITALLIVILGITALSYKKAKKEDNYESLPELEVIENRTSTSISRTTISTTRSTEAIKVSPYYDVKVDELYNDELLVSKANNNRNAELMSLLINYAKPILDIKDESLIKVNEVKENVKENEVDRIVYGGEEYIIIYNGKELLNKLFTKEFVDNMLYIKANNKPVFITYRDNYYRINLKTYKSFKILDTSFKLNNKGTLNAVAKFSGYYESKVSAIFEDGRWKIKSFLLPSYTQEIPETTTTTTESTTTTTSTTTIVEEVTNDANI